MILLKASETSRYSGFTLIELAIVVAIVALILTWGLGTSLDFYRQVNIHSERDVVVSMVRSARSKALANTNQSDYGFYAGATEYTVFEGSSYVTRVQPLDATFPRSDKINVTGLTEVVFRAGSALPLGMGTITLEDGARSLTITIENEGRITWQ